MVHSLNKKRQVEGSKLHKKKRLEIIFTNFNALLISSVLKSLHFFPVFFFN